MRFKYLLGFSYNKHSPLFNFARMFDEIPAKGIKFVLFLVPFLIIRIHKFLESTYITFIIS